MTATISELEQLLENIARPARALTPAGCPAYRTRCQPSQTAAHLIEPLHGRPR